MSTEISVNVRRAFIETNLEQCKKNIALSMWQIGNLLNQAKDEGVVPHGEWTAWATTHSGLNERGVQLAMRQARELAQDSPLLELDDSKINALIDKAAEKTKEVERLRGEVKKQTRATESALREANVYKDSAEVLKKMNDTYTTQVIELKQNLETMTAPEIEELKKHIEELKDKLKAAENNTTLADSERAAYERRIEQLEDELDAADMRANVSTMRGGGQAVDPISTINAAIGAMIASAGGSVAALGAVQMDDGTRQMLMSHAVTLRTMSQAILDAIGG